MTSVATAPKFTAGQIGVPGQGPFMTIVLTLDGETITDAKFQTYPCPAASVCGNFVTTWAVQDANGHRTTMNCDPRSSLLSQRDPLGAFTSYSYDSAKNQKLRIDARGLPTRPGRGAALPPRLPLRTVRDC